MNDCIISLINEIKLLSRQLDSKLQKLEDILNKDDRITKESELVYDSTKKYIETDIKFTTPISPMTSCRTFKKIKTFKSNNNAREYRIQGIRKVRPDSKGK